MNFREKLEYLMHRNGNMRCSDLARETGIAYTTLDGILKRDTFENVKFSTLEKLCLYFDVDMRYLVSDAITDPGYRVPMQTLGAFTPTEQQLIDCYRLASDDDKAVVDTVLRKYRKPELQSKAI